MPKHVIMIDTSIKIVLLGSSKVGKTSLVRRFIENKFIDNDEFTSTIGGAFISKEIYSTDQQRVTLCIWDTAGEEKYESITRTFYRNAKAAIVCYDVTSMKSWDRAKRWVSELRQFEEGCTIYLCATKIDLIRETNAPRVVPGSVLSIYISDVNVKKHFETSSKSGENVGNMFRTIVKDYMEINKNNLPQDGLEFIQHNENPKKACCLAN